MDRYSVESTTLTGIADAIREKTGSSEDIKVEDMAGKIGEISGGGGSVYTIEIRGINLYNTNELVYYFDKEGNFCSISLSSGWIDSETIQAMNGLVWTTSTYSFEINEGDGYVASSAGCKVIMLTSNGIVNLMDTSIPA